MTDAVETTRVQANQLILDERIYPRAGGIDRVHVYHLRLAIQAGENLPPILVSDTGILVDGAHRRQAYIDEFGPDVEIPAIVKHYESEQAMIEEAVRANVKHGKALTSQDLTRVAHLLRPYGVDVPHLARLFGRPLEYTQRIVVREARTESSDDEKPKVIPIKFAVKHLAGKEITEEQVDAHRAILGTPLSLQIRQLRSALENGLIPTNNREVIRELRLLYQSLDRFLSQVKTTRKRKQSVES